MNEKSSTGLRDTVLTLVGIFLLLGMARYSSAIIVPFLLALFITVIASTPVNWLKRKGIGDIPAVGLVLLATVVVLLLFSILLGNTVVQFNEALPVYQEKLDGLMEKIVILFSEKGVNIESAGMMEALDPGMVMTFANTLVSGLADVFSNTILIMFTAMFMLFDVLEFPRKMKAVEGSGSEKVLEQIALLVKSTNDYMVIKAIISLGTGILIGLGLKLVGLDFALLWGAIAFALNFVPNIGSILAAIPAVLLALVQLGPTSTLIVMVIYGSVNTIMGNVVEPKIMGKRLGLSTLTVFLSLVFWGWVFGAVGMLLSVPLTMAVKFAVMNNPQTKWFGILLSPAPEEVEPSTPHSKSKKATGTKNKEKQSVQDELNALRQELELLEKKKGEKANLP